jgi:(p)ppGpp synthase/HD superfamily hydrolase
MPEHMNDPRLTSRFHDAVGLALLLHQKQLRKGTDTPYVGHLLAVTALVIEHGGSEDQAIAAVLHDAVEDQGGEPTLALIRESFGEVVAELVAALSDTDVTPKPPWRARKEAYIAHVAEIPEAAVLVALADKVHNARAIVRDVRELGDEVWARFSASGREEVIWYYRELARSLRGRTDGALMDELEAVVREMDELATQERPDSRSR